MMVALNVHLSQKEQTLKIQIALITVSYVKEMFQNFRKSNEHFIYKNSFVNLGYIDNMELCFCSVG